MSKNLQATAEAIIEAARADGEWHWNEATSDEADVCIEYFLPDGEELTDDEVAEITTLLIPLLEVEVSNQTEVFADRVQGLTLHELEEALEDEFVVRPFRRAIEAEISRRGETSSSTDSEQLTALADAFVAEAIELDYWPDRILKESKPDVIRELHFIHDTLAKSQVDELYSIIETLANEADLTRGEGPHAPA